MVCPVNLVCNVTSTVMEWKRFGKPVTRIVLDSVFSEFYFLSFFYTHYQWVLNNLYNFINFNHSEITIWSVPLWNRPPLLSEYHFPSCHSPPDLISSPPTLDLDLISSQTTEQCPPSSCPLSRAHKTRRRTRPRGTV